MELVPGKVIYYYSVADIFISFAYLDAAVNSLILDTQFVFLTAIQNILREERTFIKYFSLS